MNQDDEFNSMAGEIGFRKNRKRPLIFESGSNEWIAKMCIRKKIVETENYCAKFKEKNCYIFYTNNYFVVKRIQLHFNSTILHCKKVVTKRISMNTVEVLNFTEDIELPEEYSFEKVVPVLVNKKVFLARMPNNYLNE